MEDNEYELCTEASRQVCRHVGVSSGGQSPEGSRSTDPDLDPKITADFATLAPYTNGGWQHFQVQGTAWSPTHATQMARWLARLVSFDTKGRGAPAPCNRVSSRDL